MPCMDLPSVVRTVADVLYSYDQTRPVHKTFSAGIGPFAEKEIVNQLAKHWPDSGQVITTQKTPDFSIDSEWAIEFKIARPFGDNGKPAEHWSQNLLHPYPGHVSSISDALKLNKLENYEHKAIIVLGYEHSPAVICLDPLLDSFEAIMKYVIKIALSQRIEEKRDGMVHPIHKVLRCIGWELLKKAESFA